MESERDTSCQSQLIQESEASFIAAGIFNSSCCVDHDEKCGNSALDRSWERGSQNTRSYTKTLSCQKDNLKGERMDKERACIHSRGLDALDMRSAIGNYKSENQRVDTMDSVKEMNLTHSSPKYNNCVQTHIIAPGDVPNNRPKAKRLEIILEEKELKEEKVPNGCCRLRSQLSKRKNAEGAATSSKQKSNTGVEAVVESLYAKKMQEIRSGKGKLRDKKVRPVLADKGVNPLRSAIPEEALEERPAESRSEDKRDEKAGAMLKVSVPINVATKERSGSAAIKNGAVSKVMPTKDHVIGNSPGSNGMLRTGRGAVISEATTTCGNRISQKSTQPNTTSCLNRSDPANDKGCAKETSTSIRGKEVPDEKENLSFKCQLKECKGAEGLVLTRQSPRMLLEKVEVIDQSSGKESLGENLLGSKAANDISGTLAASQTSVDSSKPSEVYLILPHAVECKGTKCKNRDCYIANQFILHVSACYQQSKGGCHICIAMDAMVCKHAKVCSIPLHESCPIPSCNKVKVKVLEQWMKLKVKHNELMQKAFEMKVHARTCRGDCCHGKSCRTMKKIVLHVNKCQKGDSCPTRKFLASICKSHKESCSKESCPIDICQTGKKGCPLPEENPDDENKENIDPVRKLNFSYPLKTGKVDVASSTTTKKDGKDMHKVTLESEEAPPKVSVATYPSEEIESGSAKSTLQVLSGHLNSTSAAYENFSFFSNVYQPDSRSSASNHSHTMTSSSSDSIARRSASAPNNEMEKLGTSVQQVELSQKKAVIIDRNAAQRSSSACTVSTKDTFPEDERGVSLLKPTAMRDEQQRNDLELCSPLNEADKSQEASSKKIDSNYRLYSLWPDPTSSLPTFSPTEIQKILRVSSHDLNENSRIVTESETVEDILNLKDIDVPLPEKTLYSHCLDERKQREEPQKHKKSMEKVKVLTTPDSTEHKTRFPFKRHCVRRLFPLD